MHDAFVDSKYQSTATSIQRGQTSHIVRLTREMSGASWAPYELTNAGVDRFVNMAWHTASNSR